MRFTGLSTNPISIKSRFTVPYFPKKMINANTPAKAGKTIGKWPQENEHGARQITRRAKRQGDGEKSPEAAGSLDFGGFFKGGIDVGETGGKTQDDKREHVQGLNEYQPVSPVDEIDGLLDQSRIHQEQIQRSILAEKDDECKYAGKSGQNNRQKNQGCENGLATVPVSRQNVCQGHPEDGGRQEHQRTQKQGISKGFKIIGVLEKFQVIADAPAAGCGDFEAFLHQN